MVAHTTAVSRRQRRKAARLAESAARYDPALERRDRTAAALDRLPTKTWTVLSGVPWPGRRGVKIDHVVVGPPGIFVIVDQASPWPAWTWKEELVREQHGLTAAEEASWAVAQLTPTVPMRLVHPVICLVRDQSVSGQINDVLVCTTANVAEVLEERVHELSAEQMRVAPVNLRAHVLDSSAAKVPAARPKPDSRPRTHPPRARMPWEPREESWRKGTKRSGLTLPLITTVMAAVVFITAPGAVIDGAQAFGELFAEMLAR